jgi:hypothetical protein
MTSRKQPGVAFWATVVVVVALVGYPLSFGPACWWFSKPRSDGTWMFNFRDLVPKAPQVYWPIGWVVMYGPDPVSYVIQRYVLLGTDHVLVPFNPHGDETSIIRIDE